MSEAVFVIRPTDRPYRVYLGNELLLETSDVIELDATYGETVLPRVPYFSPHVADALDLRPSTTEVPCKYKGIANYFHLREIEDAVWTYRHPKPEVTSITDHIAFETKNGIRVVRVEN